MRDSFYLILCRKICKYNNLSEGLTSALPATSIVFLVRYLAQIGTFSSVPLAAGLLDESEEVFLSPPPNLAAKALTDIYQNRLGRMLKTSLRRLVTPSMHFRCVNEIPFEHLKDIGIKAVVFDRDFTLTEPTQFSLRPDAIVGLKNCFEHIQHISILSNSAGYARVDKNFLMAKKLEKLLFVSVVRHLKMKPFCFADILSHFKSQVSLEPSEIAIVGDRLLTDVYLANKNGARSILVDSFTDTDFPWLNKLERVLFSIPPVSHSPSRPMY